MCGTRFPLHHPTLTLADIAPKKSRAYSAALHRYLKAHGLFYPDGGVAQGVYMANANTMAARLFGAHTLLIGYTDGQFFHGTKLNTALQEGENAQCIAHPIAKHLSTVPRFWENYLHAGLCAIDHDHTDSCAKNRYAEHADSRTCRWCGHKQHKVMRPQIVLVATWVNERDAQNDHSASPHNTAVAMRRCRIVT